MKRPPSAALLQLGGDKIATRMIMLDDDDVDQPSVDQLILPLLNEPAQHSWLTFYDKFSNEEEDS